MKIFKFIVSKIFLRKAILGIGIMLLLLMANYITLRDHVTKFERENPERGRFIWDFTTIKEILSNPVYIGAIASQKVNYRFKIGWMGDKKREDWIIVLS